MIELLAKQIGAIIVQALRRQYSLQGHRLTGKLNSSIEAVVSLTVTGARISILMEEYGIVLNNGVPASRIPFDPDRRTGAKRSKAVEGVAAFVRKIRFGLSAREVLNMTFAILTTWKKKGGMPSRGSFRFSKTGKRTGAINEALQDTEKEIEELTAQFLEEIIINNLAA